MATREPGHPALPAPSLVCKIDRAACRLAHHGDHPRPQRPILNEQVLPIGNGDAVRLQARARMQWTVGCSWHWLR